MKPVYATLSEAKGLCTVAEVLRSAQKDRRGGRPGGLRPHPNPLPQGEGIWGSRFPQGEGIWGSRAYVCA